MMTMLNWFADKKADLFVEKRTIMAGVRYYVVNKNGGWQLREARSQEEAEAWLKRTGIPQSRHCSREIDPMKENLKRYGTRIIVAGGRDFNDPVLMNQKLSALTKNLKKFLIITGGAEGADRLAENWAFHHMVPYAIFHPDWKKNGAKAGFLRNLEMAKQADAVIAFWDGASKGTKHMIDIAEKRNLKLRIVRYTNNGKGTLQKASPKNSFRSNRKPRSSKGLKK